MRPRKRFQKTNDSTEVPSSILFLDAESWQPPEGDTAPVRTLRLRLWCACYVRRENDQWRAPIYHDGKKPQALWDLVDRYCQWKKPLWVFAHNVGFDFTQLDFWTQLERYRYTSGPVEREPHPETGKERKPWRGRLFVEGRPTFMVLQGRRGFVKVVDTGNYWPSKLAEIGEMHGLAKLPMPGWDEPEKDWQTYCRRDVDVCRVAVCDLVDRWAGEDCGIFQVTAPALAMHNWRHWWKTHNDGAAKTPILLEDDSPARAIERAAYLGGRVQPFFLGAKRGKFVHLDCNALYGHVMARELFPCRRVRKLYKPSVADLERYSLAYGTVAQVVIDTGRSDETYPLKRHGVQLHACGLFPTSLCGPELLRALRNGHVGSVNECHLYSMQALFRGWADHWIQRKQECRDAGDEGGAEFAKLIYTSLPGKFGQRGDWWLDHPSRRRSGAWGLSAVVDLVKEQTSIYRYVAGHCQRKTPGAEPPSAFPIISAYVTSYAREHMRRAFALLPDRSLLYTATDSIICDLRGLAALEAAGMVHETMPGHFRVKSRPKDMEIKGPNWYREDQTWVAGGLWGRAKRDLDGNWVCEVWDQLGTLVGANPHGEVRIRTHPLSEMKPTAKGTVDAMGWVSPFRFSGDEDFTDRPPRPRYPFRPE